VARSLGDDRMNVLVVSSLYDRPGGFTGQHIHRLCRELVEHDVRLRVFCPLPRFDRKLGFGNLGRFWRRPHLLVRDGVEVLYLPYANVPHRVSPILEISRLRRCLARAVTDLDTVPSLIHAHWLFPTGDAAILLARDLGIPVVVSARGSDVHTYPAANPRVAGRTRKVIETADRVTAVSDELAGQVTEMAASRRPVVTVRGGVDTERFYPMEEKEHLRAELGLPVDGTGFISVCRLNRNKGVFELIQAFQRTSAAFEDAWLVLVGDGPEAEALRQIVSESGLEDRVIFAGVRPNELIPKWLNAADVFVLASHAEGLPNVLLEAMACGLPVVATKVGGAEEATGAGSGLLVNPADADDLATAMQSLAGSRILRQRMGDTARDRIGEHFQWSRVADEYISIYQEILTPTGAGPK